MASGQAVWGIDLGKCALRAIRLRTLTEGLVEAVGHTYIEHDTILSDAHADRDLKIGQALEKFLSQNDISSDQIVVSVPGQHTLARFSPLPPVEPKKIPDLVRYEADQQIPFDMDEVIWDYQTFQEEGAPEIQVGIFAMKRELIRDYLGHFEAAGIEPVIVQAAPLALYNAAHFDGLIGRGTTVLVNIGAENTDLIIGSARTLWTRTIPIGGNNFTEALVKAFKLSFSKAENLKKSAATSKYARRIFQAMRPVFADLVQELQRSIGRYTSAHRDAELTKVIGVGNAFQLPVLQKYLQQNLQLDVERPAGFDKIQFGPGVNAAELNEVLPGFGVAYGLGLQGLGLSTIETNLLPPEIARHVLWRKKRPFFGAAAACLLLASGLIWVRQFRDMGTLETAQGTSVAPIASLEQARSVIDAPQSGLPPRIQAQRILSAVRFLKAEYSRIAGGGGNEEKKIQQIRQLQKNKVVLLRLLDVVHRALPTPEGALANATTPEAYRQAVADAKTPREHRREIFIEKLTCEYTDDLDDEALAEKMVDRSREADAHTVEAPPNTPRKGFVVELSCRTPYRKVAPFVNETLKKNLRTLGRRPKMGFYIDRVALTAVSRVAAGGTAPEPDTLPGRRPKRGGSGRGRGRGEFPDRTSPRDAVHVDPITDEPMDSDWQFSIVFDVVLADYPEPQEKKEEGPTPEPGP